MKAQNKEEKLAKQQEREKLQREIAAREKAEKLQVKNSFFDVHLLSALRDKLHKYSFLINVQTY